MVIVGGGVGGLASALVLKRIGCHVKLLEATAGPLSSVSSSSNDSPLYTALWTPSLQILKHCDLFQEIEKHLQPVSRIKVQDLEGNLLAQSSPLKKPLGLSSLSWWPLLIFLTEAPSLGYINDRLLYQTLYQVKHLPPSPLSSSSCAQEVQGVVQFDSKVTKVYRSPEEHPPSH